MAEPKTKPATKKLGAQNVRPTIVAAINSFLKLIDDADIINGGQFVWATHYGEKLRALALTSINSSPALNTLWNAQRPTVITNRKKIKGATPLAITSLLDDLMEVTVAPITVGGSDDSRAEFNRVKNIALQDPAMQTGSAPVQALIALLANNREGDGETIFKQCTAKIRSGVGVPKDGVEFGKIFLPSRLSFKGALRLSQISQVQCFETVDAICAYIAKKRGLRTVSPEDAAEGFGQVFLGDFRGNPQGLSPGLRRFQSPLFDLVKYTEDSKQTLERAVGLYAKALDKGHLVRAGVVSGITAEKPPSNPDHFLCLLAWERRDLPVPHTVFAFWDPDGGATVDIAGAFGRLFFMRGAEVQSRALSDSDQLSIGTPARPPHPAVPPYDANFYAKSGRFTTAFFESELRCDFGGDFQVRPERPQFKLRTNFTGPKVSHRYQVTTVDVNAGLVFPKKKSK